MDQLTDDRRFAYTAVAAYYGSIISVMALFVALHS
jgi:hypothetical protein